MQAITDLWKTTIGKLTIIGGGGIAGLLSICFLCTICSIFIGSNDTAQEKPTEIIVESLLTETTQPQPTEAPIELLLTDTPVPLPPTETLVPTVVEARPTETLVSEVVEPIVIANENDINLRSGPGTDYEMIGTLLSGGSLKIVGRNPDSSWWQVSRPEGLAWIAASVVTVNNVDDTIPIVEAPPPPAQSTSTETPPQPTAVPSGPAFTGETVDPSWWPCQQDQIKGNRNSMIYHSPGGSFYAKTYEDVECFNTAEEASNAGYRASKR